MTEEGALSRFDAVFGEMAELGITAVYDPGTSTADQGEANRASRTVS